MAGALTPAEVRRWSAERVHALAPDAPSGKAGRKLAAPGPWSGCGARAEAGLGWGDCKGSGARPYEFSVELRDDRGEQRPPAYACTCPSRKFPCKHALGLLLLWSAGGVPEADAAPPRVAEWLTGRRERAERGEARKAAQAEKAANAVAAADAGVTAADDPAG